MKLQRSVNKCSSSGSCIWHGSSRV